MRRLGFLALILGTPLLTQCNNDRPALLSPADAHGGTDQGLRSDADAVEDIGSGALDAAPSSDAGADGAVVLDAASDGGSADGAVSDGSNGDGFAGDLGATDATIADAGADAGVPDLGQLGPLSPSLVTIPLGGSQRFTFTASAGAIPGWAVDGQLGGNAINGTVVADPDPRTALYQAPQLALVIPTAHTLTASIPGSRGSAQINLVFAAPSITMLTPTSALAGSSTLSVTIDGSGFAQVSSAFLDGVALATSFQNFNRLTAMIPSALLASAFEHRLTVITPAPGGGTAAALFPVVFQEVVLGPGVDPAVPGLFGGAIVGTSTARAPRITYPEDGSVAPLDFPAPTASFAVPVPSNICRLRLSAPAVLVEAFASTTAPRPVYANPSITLDVATWRALEATTTDPLTLRLEIACGQVIAGPLGSPILADGQIYGGSAVNYTVARDAAGGRIVYFSGAVQGLWRIDIGALNAVGLPYIGPDPAFAYQTPQCVGCHSFNRSGTLMSFSENLDTWRFGTVDVLADPPQTQFDAAGGGETIWTALHPDRPLALGVGLDARIYLQNASTGQRLMPGPLPAGTASASQPLFSPLGDQLVFITGEPRENGDADFADGQIWSAPFDPSVPLFGPPMRLVGPDVNGGTAYYPAFSPDGQWVIFCRAPSGSSYNNAGGKLWLIKADGSVGPIALDRANQIGRLTNSWPRWAPNAHLGRYWLVFSSQRGYPPLIGTGPQQLWATEIDTNLLPADPSSPAIWLSGQAPFTGNLTGEWTEAQ